MPVLVADAHDRPALDALVRRTKVVCTTVGPYARHGSELVAACAEAGTHYCDLTGEVPWMHRMIERHHERARAHGTRIVLACGIDAVPSDLGTWALQQEIIARTGRPAERVTGLFGEWSGGVSGGTALSLMLVAEEAAKDPEVRRLLDDPYSLDPEPRGPRPPAPDETGAGWNRHLRMFTAPYAIAKINSRLVRRSHALAGLPWGKDFVYREVMATPGSVVGAAMAGAAALVIRGVGLAARSRRLREIMLRRLPQPGEGPSPEVRARGYWTMWFVAETGANGSADVQIYAMSDPSADPGYGSTAKMLAESALSLALDPLTSEGGVITPSLAMGSALLDRLRRAGLTFGVAG